MAFKLKPKVALKVCTDQVEALISRPEFRDTIWTRESLKAYLLGLGISYSEEEIALMNDELHTRGIVEDTED